MASSVASQSLYRSELYWANQIHIASKVCKSFECLFFKTASKK